MKMMMKGKFGDNDRHDVMGDSGGGEGDGGGGAAAADDDDELEEKVIGREGDDNNDIVWSVQDDDKDGYDDDDDNKDDDDNVNDDDNVEDNDYDMFTLGSRTTLYLQCNNGYMYLFLQPEFHYNLTWQWLLLTIPKDEISVTLNASTIIPFHILINLLFKSERNRKKI